MWCCCSTTSATNNTSWCLAILPSPGFCPRPFVKTDFVNKQKSQANRRHSVDQSLAGFFSPLWPPEYPLHSHSLRKLRISSDWWKVRPIIWFVSQTLRLRASSWDLQWTNSPQPLNIGGHFYSAFVHDTIDTCYDTFLKLLSSKGWS